MCSARYSSASRPASSGASAPCAGRGETSPPTLTTPRRRRPRPSSSLGPSPTPTSEPGATTSDLLLTIDIAASSHVGQSNKVLRVALPGLCRGAPETTRSWDGILCVELVPSLHALVNPLTGARTVVSAPAPRRHTRGYVAGAYSQPVTGIFHLLHCTSQQAIGDDDDDAPVTTCFRLMRVDGASASDWRDIPMSTEADTATLQTVAGYNLCASSATVHGRLHWRDMLRGQEELLVFDTGTEEFGSMPLPRQMIAAGDVVVVQQAITTLSGKLCLLRGLAEGVVEVWVLEEDYRAGDWWLTQRFDTGCTTPLHVVKPSSYLGNVGLVAAEDRVEKIVFCDGRRKLVYDVRRRSRLAKAEG
nr:unnamed protein product [Digitaria exilis]